nr:hypothetical protein I308_06687 [Cryptococcus tetragattii IND107]
MGQNQLMGFERVGKGILFLYLLHLSVSAPIRAAGVFKDDQREGQGGEGSTQ